LSAAPNPSPHSSEAAREIGREAMTDCPVLITGAGPTGLVLALWLTRLGVRVRIIDKAAEPGTTSRAVAVTARTLELYRQLDLAGAVVEAGVQVAAANLWVGGAKAARLPLGRMGEGLTVQRSALLVSGRPSPRIGEAQPGDQSHDRGATRRLGTRVG
jgi:NADPH-dependent 2,4-dienoyl-CoA reductase/sulfur reductase-like enzyme